MVGARRIPGNAHPFKNSTIWTFCITQCVRVRIIGPMQIDPNSLDPEATYRLLRT